MELSPLRSSLQPGSATASSKVDRLHGLDTLRALAILLVMPFHLSDHLPEAWQPASHFGWIGVDLFFVLSGFLIGSQLFRPYLSGRRLGMTEFYRKRAYRILPAFLVVLLLYVTVPTWREAPGMQPWWQFATFTENFLIDYKVNRAFSHAWSLCVEEHFYLVLPLLTVLLMRRSAAWKACVALFVVVLAGILLRGYVLVHVLRPLGTDADDFGLTFTRRLYYPTYTRLDGLAVGVTLALLRTFRPGLWRTVARHGHSLALAGLALIGFTLWCSTTRSEEVYGKAVVFDVFGYLLLAIGFGLLVASAISDNGVLARLRVPGAALLATLSYSLYLTHKEAVHLLFLCFPGLPDGTYRLQLLMLTSCFVIAGVLYLAVERPFLALRDRRRAGESSSAQAPDLQARVDPAL